MISGIGSREQGTGSSGQGARRSPSPHHHCHDSLNRPPHLRMGLGAAASTERQRRLAALVRWRSVCHSAHWSVRKGRRAAGFASRKLQWRCWRGWVQEILTSRRRIGHERRGIYRALGQGLLQWQLSSADIQNWRRLHLHIAEGQLRCASNSAVYPLAIAIASRDTLSLTPYQAIAAK